MLKFVACVCFSCIMSNCVDANWADYFAIFIVINTDGSVKNKKGLALDMVEFMVQVITEGISCRKKVCPGDFHCA